VEHPREADHRLALQFAQQARSGLHRECGNASWPQKDAGFKGIHRLKFRKENPGTQSAAGLLT